LADIAAKASRCGFEAPALIVVGEVVSLRKQLRWFDNQPIFGKRVLVTRSRKQASSLSQLLARHGALPIELPTIEVQAISDNVELDRAITNLRDYSWLIFTSANGVEIFFSRLLELGRDSRDLCEVKLCVIGPATAAALGRYGLVADCIPPEYLAEAIADCLREENIAGRRILMARAESVPPELVNKLTQLGAIVDELALYRTVPAGISATDASQMLLAGQIDITTFTSSSTVKNLVSMLGKNGEVVNRTRVACIGQVTAATAARLGVRVDVVAKEHTIPGLVQAIIEDYQKNKETP
jgi:uroporphyrinogen III methyltransferase/synthase